MQLHTNTSLTLQFAYAWKAQQNVNNGCSHQRLVLAPVHQKFELSALKAPYHAVQVLQARIIIKVGTLATDNAKRFVVGK